MYRGLVLLFLAIMATTNGNIIPISPMLDERIVGGHNTSIENIPYQVSVRYRKTGDHLCGGSILNSRVIITAAHCLSFEPSDYSIKYGSTNRNNGKTVKIARIDKHEGFNRNFDNDVGIIHLAEDIVFGSNARPIALASKSPAPGTDAIVSGWGRTSEGNHVLPDILQAVNVEITNHTVCRNKYADRKKEKPYMPVVTDSMVCAGVKEGGKDSCKSDSGGPLVANNELVGIVSWGEGCALPGIPGVYADVAYLRQWIDGKIKQD